MRAWAVKDVNGKFWHWDGDWSYLSGAGIFRTKSEAASGCDDFAKPVLVEIKEVKQKKVKK